MFSATRENQRRQYLKPRNHYWNCFSTSDISGVIDIIYLYSKEVEVSILNVLLLSINIFLLPVITECLYPNIKNNYCFDKEYVNRIWELILLGKFSLGIIENVSVNHSQILFGCNHNLVDAYVIPVSQQVADMFQI